MSLAKKVAINTIFQVIGRVLTVLIALVIVVYLTRYFGVEGYGHYTTIIAYLGLFTILADFGFYMVAAREMVRDEKQKEKIFNNTLTVRTVTAIGLLLLANLVVLLMPYPEVVQRGILIFSLGILAMLLNQVIIVLFQINLSTDKIAIGDVIGRLLTFILIFFAVRQGKGLEAVMWASSAGFIFTLLISIFFGSRYIMPKFRFDFDLWKKLLSQAWPIGMVLVLLSFYFRANTVFLSVIPLDHVVIPSAKGLSNAEATGLFGAPYRIMDTVIIFPSIFMGIIMPIFAKFLGKENPKAKKVLEKSMDILVIAGMAVAFMIISLSPEIISLIGGASFEKSVPILQILGFYMASFFVIMGINYFIVALGKQSKLLKPYVYVLVFNLIIGALGVYYFSYYGAAIASLIANLVLMVFGVWVLFSEKFRFSLLSFQKSLISGIIMVVVFYFLRQLSLFNSFESLSLVLKFMVMLGLILLFSLIFCALVFFLGGISKEDFKIIRN